jgi:hypothetical protein
VVSVAERAVQDRVFEYTRPHLYPLQQAAIFDERRYSVVEASTKSGKTVGCIAWLVEQAFMAPKRGRNYWWVAPSYGQAKIAWTRTKNGLTPGTFRANETYLTVTLVNGSVIWYKTGEKPDNLYGEDVWAVVVDEASRMREEAWFALRSTITATRAAARIIGNVKGKKNWFYRLARRAEAGRDDMGYHRITAEDAVAAGVLDAEEIQGAREDLPTEIFNQLYMAEAGDDEGNPFGLAHIEACIAPMSARTPRSYGVDVARKIDWTVVLGLDDHMQVCRFSRFRRPWGETEASILNEVGKVPALVDSTGVGDRVLENLQRPALLRRTSGGQYRPDAGAVRAPNFEGFIFSAPSKQSLMLNLVNLVQKHQIGFPDGPIRVEMEAFEYQYTRTGVTYSAPEGEHDDCVYALALGARNAVSARPRGVYYA